MPQLKVILEKEKERTALEQCAVAHLFREGTFYRAYEWSAWLCVRFYPDLKETHRILKGGEDIVFVDFPLTSLDRYTPEGASILPHKSQNEMYKNIDNLSLVKNEKYIF